MAQSVPCPTDPVLQQLFDGAIRGRARHDAIAHVENCPACAKRLQKLAPKGALDGDAPTVADKLAARLRALDSADSLHTVGVEAGSPPAPSPPREGTLPVGIVMDEEDDESHYLLPPQAPGELGRLGPYRILSVLGSGGMGKVYEAEDPALERKVALKVMKASIAANSKSKQRFMQEARAAAKIEHDNIVPIYQVGEDRGIPFLAMPLLAGRSLEEILKKSGKLKPMQVVNLGCQIAEGLKAAHDRGMIHRDIKPANLWIEPVKGGRVRILDFGLARSTAGEARLTQSGAILGTPAYMAPEQARGESVDHRCDLFSLGCVLYCMCTGELPFRGNDTMGVLLALAMHDPTPPTKINADVPAPLSDLIMKLLEKDPDKRVSSADKVIAVLQGLQQGTVVNVQEAIVAKDDTAIPVKRKKNDSAIKPSGVQSGINIALPALTKRKPLLLGVGAAALVGALLSCVGLSAVLYYFTTHSGVILVEANDPDIKLALNKADAAPLEKGKREFRVSPGEHRLLVHFRDIEPIEIDKLALARGGRIAIKIEHAEGKLVVRVGDQVRAERLVPQGGVPRGGIAELAWSGDGALLAATFPLDNKLALIDAKSLKILKEFTTGKDLPQRLSWSPNGHWLAFVEGAGIRIVGANGNEAARYADAPTAALAWHPQGSWLALGGNNARLWLVRPDGSKRLELTKPGPTSFVGIDWHPTNGTFVACDGVKLSIWKPEEPERAQLEANAAPGSPFIYWTPQGKLLGVPGLALMSADGKIEKSMPFNFNQGFAAFVPHPKGDGFIGTAGPSGLGQAWFFQWDGAVGKELMPGRSSLAATRFSSDGRYLSRIGGTGDVHVFEWGADPVERVKLPVRAAALAWHPKGKEFAVASSYPSSQGVLRVYDPAGKVLRALRGPLVVPETPTAPAPLLASSAFDKLRREDIDPAELQVAGDKDAPKELVAILGDSRWQSPETHTVIGISATNQLATSTMGAIVIWNPQSGQPATRLVGANALSPAFDVYADNVGRDFKIRDVKTGEILGAGNLRGDDSRKLVAFSGDGRLVGFGTNTIGPAVGMIFEARTGKLLHSVEHLKSTGDGKGIYALAFSPKGDLFATAATDDFVKIWDVASGKEIKQIKAATRHLAFSPDGKRLTTCSPGPGVLWNVETGERVSTLAQKFDAHVPSPREEITASQSSDGIDLWDAKTGQKLRRLTDSAGCSVPVFTSDGKTIVATPPKGRVARFWAVATGAVLPEPALFGGSALDVVVAKDGQSLLAGHQDCRVHSWDIATRKSALKATVGGGRLQRMVIAPNRKFAAYFWDQPLGLWDLDRNGDYQTFHIHGVRPPAAISPDGKYVVCVGGHGNLLHRLGDPRVDHFLSPQHGQFGAFSPDSQLVARIGAAADAGLYVHAVSGGHLLLEQRGIAGPVEFHPGGTTLACAQGAAVQLWDLRVPEVVLTIPGNAGIIQHLTFRPDGQRLAVLGDKGLLVVRDLARKDDPIVAEIHLGDVGKSVNRLTFTPDGRHLVTANGNGTIYVLRITEK